MSVRGDIIVAMLEQLQTLRDITLTDGTIREIIQMDKKLAKPENYDTPIVVMTDTGHEELLVQDGSAYRYATDIAITAEVRDEDGERALATLNNIGAEVKKIVDQSPSLGDNFLKMQWRGFDSITFQLENARAWLYMNVRIIYFADAGAF